MPTVRLGPDGRPLPDPGGYAFGGAGGSFQLGGQPPAGGGAGGGGTAPAGSRANPNATLPGAVYNPTPANYLNPWLPSVTAGMNGQPVNFASPGRPNSNYATPQAAGALAKDLGANLVTQNLSNMASPGSPAPSAPMYGLDFGRGDVQGADVGLTGQARGDSPESIAARYQAGLNTKAWAGPNPVPVTNPADNTFWNRTTPVAQNTPSPAQAGFFAAQPQPNVAPVTGGTGLPPQVQQILQQMGLTPPAPPQALSGPGMNVPPGGLGGFFT